MRKIARFCSSKLSNKCAPDEKDNFVFSTQQIIRDLTECYEKQRKENRQQKVYGYKNLCKIFSIQSKSKKAERSKAILDEANRMAFKRKMARYGFSDYIKEDFRKNRPYMLKKDINKIKRNYILGLPEIAKYIGINKKYPNKILYRLKKEFPMMPVDLSSQIAYKEKLAEWECFHFFYKWQKSSLASSLSLGKSLNLFFNLDLHIRNTIEKSPIMEDIKKLKQCEKFRKRFMVLFKGIPTNTIPEKIRNYLKNSRDFLPPKDDNVVTKFPVLS